MSQPSQKRKAMRLSLRYLFVLVLLGVQLFMLLGVLVSSHVNTENVLRDHTQQVMGHLSSVAAENATRFLSPAGRTAELSVVLLAEQVVGTEDISDLETYFLGQLRENTEFSGVYFGQPDGSFLFVSHKSDGFLTKHITAGETRNVIYSYRNEAGAFLREEAHPEDEYDPRERPWYQKAVTQEKQIWTEPYVFFTSKRPGITAAKPVYAKSGELLGVVGVDIEISGLSSFFESVPISENGSAFMMNADGTALAFPGINQALKQSGEKPTLPHVADLGSVPNALVSKFQSQPLGSSSRRDFLEFEVAGTLYYGMVSPFGIGDATWLVGVYGPASDFVGSIQKQNKRHLWQVLAIGLLSCLVALPLVFGVTRPLQRLHKQATRDSLTDLPNRSEFLQQAEWLAAQARRNKQGVALAMLDLDGFKLVNDRYGHQAGDVVLETVAKRLLGRLRQDDLVARFGGDEFAVLLVNVSESEATMLVERLRKSVASEPVRAADVVYHVGASAGVAIMGWGETVTDTLNRADQALLEAKASGKNRTQGVPYAEHHLQIN
jgi:diguanylate cyclase (GGDEF)-like protein